MFSCLKSLFALLRPTCHPIEPFTGRLLPEFPPPALACTAWPPVGLAPVVDCRIPAIGVAGEIITASDSGVLNPGVS